jgi:hypothetical protein
MTKEGRGQRASMLKAKQVKWYKGNTLDFSWVFLEVARNAMVELLFLFIEIN